MNKNIKSKTAIILVAAMLLPFASSCSLFGKKAVINAVTEFGDAIKTGDASDILHKTDDISREYKKSFKELLDLKNYTEEESAFATHMISTVEYTIDEKSIKINKDKATAGITLSIADLEELKKKDYKDITDLTSAVDSATKKETEITLELNKVDKEWYVTNLEDNEFREFFSFYGSMPVIGRATLIDTAGKLAAAIKNDDSGAAIYLAGSNATPETIQAVKEYFDVDGNPTKEDNAFRAAVRDGMSYEIDESSVVIEGNNGSVNIILRRPNFEVLAGKNFSSIPEIEKAVKECEIINFEYKCDLERNGTEWFVTNLDSVSFGGLLSYKKFKISMKSVDGTYKSSMDITDKFINYISKEYKVSIPSDCEGRIYIRSTMVLKNGKYEVKIDRDAFAADIKSFVEKNIDKIIKKISVKNLLLISAVAFLIKTLLMLIAPNMIVVYISQAMQMFAYAVFIPAGAYFVNQTMERLDQVKGQAYINVSITLGGVFSSLVCGRLLDIKGPHFMLIVSFAVTTVGLIIAFLALKVVAISRKSRS